MKLFYNKSFCINSLLSILVQSFYESFKLDYHYWLNLFNQLLHLLSLFLRVILALRLCFLYLNLHNTLALVQLTLTNSCHKGDLQLYQRFLRINQNSQLYLSTN